MTFSTKVFSKGCHKRDKTDEYQQLAAIKGVTNLYNSLTIRALGRIVTPFAKKSSGERFLVYLEGFL